MVIVVSDRNGWLVEKDALFHLSMVHLGVSFGFYCIRKTGTWEKQNVFLKTFVFNRHCTVLGNHKQSNAWEWNPNLRQDMSVVSCEGVSFTSVETLTQFSFIVSLSIRWLWCWSWKGWDWIKVVCVISIWYMYLAFFCLLKGHDICVMAETVGFHESSVNIA